MSTALTDSGLGSGLGSDSGSGSGSGSPSSSSESEHEFVRPVFLKKRTTTTTSQIQKSSVLEKAERLHQIDKKTVEKLPYDGVDDTDNIDPEGEYRAWRERERERRERDQTRVAEAEAAKEEAVRRKLGGT